MKSLKEAWPIYLCFSMVALVVIFAIFMAFSLSERDSGIRDSCVATESYIMGYKGHIARVYDCTGVDTESLF